MKEMPTQLRQYWSYRDELSVENGMQLKGERIVIHRTMQKDILQLIRAGHQGAEKCKLRARSCVFWNSMNTDIDKKCSPVCDMSRVPVCDMSRVLVCDMSRVSVCDMSRVPVCDMSRVSVCDMSRVSVCATSGDTQTIRNTNTPVAGCWI